MHPLLQSQRRQEAIAFHQTRAMSARIIPHPLMGDDMVPVTYLPIVVFALGLDNQVCGSKAPGIVAQMRNLIRRGGVTHYFESVHKLTLSTSVYSSSLCAGG